MAVNSFNAQNPPVTTKGDVFTFSTIPTRLGVGANNTVLTADSTTATGLKWASAASGVTSWSLLNAGGTALTGATSITISGISNQKELLICVDSGSSATASAEFYIRPNAVSAADYSVFGWRYIQQATYGSNNSIYATYTGGTEIPFGRMGNAAPNSISGSVYLTNCDTTGWKRFISTAGGSGDSTGRLDVYQGLWEASAAVTSIQIVSSAGNFDAGTIYVFGGV